MLRPAEFWILTAAAAASAAVLAASTYQLGVNRELRAEIDRRAQFVQQTVPLENLSREIATALAQLSVQGQDAEIRSMLSSLGISVNVSPSNPVPAGPAAREAPSAAPAPAGGQPAPASERGARR